MTAISKSFFRSKALFVFILIVIACTFIAALLSVKLFLFCLFLLFPTIAAVIIDHQEDKCLSLTIGLCNISGIMLHAPALMKLNSLSIVVLQNIYDIATIYSFSAFGLILYFVVPQINKFFYIVGLKISKNRINRQLKKLHSKWDLS